MMEYEAYIKLNEVFFPIHKKEELSCKNWRNLNFLQLKKRDFYWCKMHKKFFLDELQALAQGY